MNKKPISVAVLGTDLNYGGKNCDLIYSVLERYIDDVDLLVALSENDLAALELDTYDAVFLRSKAAYSWALEYLEKHSIPFTGSDTATMQFDIDKESAKIAVHNAGIRTAEHVTASTDTFTAGTFPLHYPVFVKPLLGFGDGRGIDEHSVAHDFEQMQSKVNTLSEEFESDALIETYLDGTEYSVAVIEDPTTGELSAFPLQLVIKSKESSGLLDAHTRKNRFMYEFVPVEDETIKQSLVSLVESAAKALNVRGYGRIDVKANGQGELHFLEANLRPGMPRLGVFAEAIIQGSDMTYDDIIMKILDSALSNRS